MEAMKIRNWILCFGCASEDFRVVLVRLSDWMSNFFPPWAAYHTLMACCLVVLDKRPGVRPVRIGEKLRLALDKLDMRESGDQVKTACGNLQLCAVLEAGINGSTQAVGKMIL